MTSSLGNPSAEALTTDAVATGKRFEYWADMVCKTYVQLECDAPKSDDFSGSIVSHRLPGLHMSIVNSRPQLLMRTPRGIAGDSDDFFFASLQIRGNAVVTQDGRKAQLASGDFAIYDSTRPYVLDFGDDFERIVLKLPGAHVRSLIRNTEALTATTISGRAGAGRLFSRMTTTLRDEVGNTHPTSTVAIVNGVLSVLMASLQSLPAAQKTELSPMSAYHVARIKQCIDDNLRDPALTIESVAAKLGMSVSHLHRLFKTEPLSPSQYLLHHRLEACCRELLDPLCANESVSGIAFSWGFNDAAHFSRAFRDRFNCSPRDWRRQVRHP